MGRLVVERIDTESRLASLGDDWEALEASTRNTLPFRTFLWTSAWWKHLHERRLTVRDSLAVRAVRDERGRLVGVAPLMVTERPGAGPIRARCVQLIGADPNMTEVRAPLFDRERQAECYAAVQEDLLRTEHGVDWIRWMGVEDAPPTRAALDAPGAAWGPGVSCFVLPLPSTWEELRASRPPNVREALRKCYRSFAREGLKIEFDVVSRGEAVEGAVHDFFDLHAARAHLDGTTRHADVFADGACRSFLLDVCGRFSDRGALRIFRLSVGHRLVATRIGFVLGGSLYLYYSGYDPAFARYSVMTTALAEALKHAIGEGLGSVNLSIGSDPSKLRWRPEETVFAEVHLPAQGWVAHLKHAALDAAKRISAPWPDAHARRMLARRGA